MSLGFFPVVQQAISDHHWRILKNRQELTSQIVNIVSKAEEDKCRSNAGSKFITRTIYFFFFYFDSLRKFYELHVNILECILVFRNFLGSF